MIQVFFWLIFLMAIAMAIFTIQNSTAPPIAIQFLFWEFRTSLIFALLGSFGMGVLFAFFLWIPRAIKTSLRFRELKREHKNLEEMLFKPAPMAGQDKPQER